MHREELDYSLTKHLHAIRRSLCEIIAELTGLECRSPEEDT
jgi:hypothetical protein